jgi:hypothetical protein
MNQGYLGLFVLSLFIFTCTDEFMFIVFKPRRVLFTIDPVVLGNVCGCYYVSFTCRCEFIQVTCVLFRG